MLIHDAVGKDLTAVQNLLKKHQALTVNSNGSPIFQYKL